MVIVTIIITIGIAIVIIRIGIAIVAMCRRRRTFALFLTGRWVTSAAVLLNAGLYIQR